MSQKGPGEEIQPGLPSPGVGVGGGLVAPAPLTTGLDSLARQRSRYEVSNGLICAVVAGGIAGAVVYGVPVINNLISWCATALGEDIEPGWRFGAVVGMIVGAIAGLAAVTLGKWG